MSEIKGTKDRGPVEELITKRLRPLNKKIQRFRGYHSKAPDTLNDDQRAALASLPQLEAVARELEDLTRAVEEAELVAAAKAREEREAIERDLDARVSARLAEFHLSTAARLGAFLNLHSLLHPARPDDHDNLTFAPPALPLRLQDEVVATDILRVARMYGDLTGGGDAGHAVLVTLSSGPPGEDDEDDRIHRLIELLSSSEPEASEDALEAQSTVPEPPQSVGDSLADEATPEGSLANGGGPADADPLRTPIVGRVGLRAFDEPPPVATLARGVALNFLQEDELLAPETEAVAAFEVVEPPSNAMSSRQSVIADSFASDWAADEENENENEHASAERLAQALGGSGAASPAPAAVEEVAAGVEAVSLSETGTPAEPAEPSAPASGAEGEGERRKTGSGRKPSGRRGGGGGGGGERKRDDADKVKPVDEDGFEVKTGRRASGPIRGRGGRGAAGGGRGRGAPREGGDRRQKTEGKEGPSANGQRRGPRKDGAPAGNRSVSGKEKEAPKPKPSIYKTVQPSAPTSAPIL